ncbi:MAG TPA: DUF4148 domain-containing protein [Noviherbaspirillum sp.]|nr:DUF4148 domain-containing protein [Noviherbaspirillum sp.]
MNAKRIFAAIAAMSAFAAAGSAFAADNGMYVEHLNVPTTKTRAEVRAELEQAHAAGRLAGNSEFVEHIHVASSKSREDVRGEAVQAARNQTGRSLYFGG